MRIAGKLSCSFVNGEGIRYVIFCQGCPHHCPGCHNKETWDFSGGQVVSIDDLVNDICSHNHIDGITLSGGEPFCQHDECVELIKRLPKHLNVWIYTGYEYDDIKDYELTKLADYIVVGKFIESKKVIGKFYGSSNQRIIDTKTGLEYNP